jgi:DNA polymerase III delta prime subunit
MADAHAYIIFSENAGVSEKIQNQHKDAEVLKISKDVFSVDDARYINNFSRNKNEKNVVVILEAVIVTAEAQNALLKTIEEPQENFTFFVIVPSGTNVLDTVMSRVTEYSVEDARSKEQFSDFQRLSLKERKVAVKEILDSESPRRLLLSLLHTLLNRDTVNKELYLRLRSCVFDQTASPKYIAEACTIIPNVSSSPK